MTKAGADMVVCHLGLTTGGAIGAQTGRKLEECPALVDTWTEAALAVNPHVLVLVRGGPASEPEDAEFVLRSTKHCRGFYGASSMERLPAGRGGVNFIDVHWARRLRSRPDRRRRQYGGTEAGHVLRLAFDEGKGRRNLTRRLAHGRKARPAVHAVVMAVPQGSG